MDYAEFEQLCRDASLALNLPYTEALVSRHQITLNGIDIGLFFDEDEAGDRLVCYIDIGEPPDYEREEIIEQLLAMNLLTGSKTSGVYGLDRRRNRVIFIQHFLYPDMMSGEILANILHDYSKHAMKVRETLFGVSVSETNVNFDTHSFSLGSAELA